MRFAGEALKGNSDYASAAGSGGDAFERISKDSPDFGTLGMFGMQKGAKEQIAVMDASAKVAGAGINSLAAATTAMNNAKAGIASAEAEASATRQNGMMSAIGSIGGAAMGAFKPKVAKTDFGSYGPSNFNLNQNFW